MKLITLLITIAFVHISTKGYNQVTLNQKNAPLEKILQSIEKQTGYVFLYTDKELTRLKIDIQVKDAPIAETLKQCFKNLPYTFKIVENNILLKKDDDIPIAVPESNKEVLVKVKGTVTDQKGMALSGATILVEHTHIGVISDANGGYQLSVPGGDAVLVCSFLGFDTYKTKVGRQNIINITMTESSQALEQVIVVVGYGTQKKESVLGAVSSISAAELGKAAPSNLTNAIGGRVPGLITKTMDGAIGGVQNRYTNGDLDDAQFFIRGKGTTNSQKPLVLIDGVEGSFSRINPEDIGQFSILKDASATAVYGVRGANGVILITTRRGSVSTPKVNVNSQVRMIKPLAFPRPLGSYDYAMLYNEARRNVGQPPFYSAADLEHYLTGDAPYTHPNVDWYNLLVKDHTMEQQHIANVLGGTDKIRYYLSAEYDQAGGLFVTSKENAYNYRRYNLRSNIDFTITRTTELGLKMNGQMNDLNFALKGESSGQRVNATAWGDIINRLPLDGQLFNPNGTYSAGTGITGWNSLSDLYEGGYARRLQNNVQTNFTLNQKLDFITAGLSFRGLYAMTFGSGSTKQFIRGGELWSYNSGTGVYTLVRPKQIPTIILVANSLNFQPFTRTRQIEASLNYDKTIAVHHKLTAMGIFIQTSDENQINLPRNFRGLSGRLTYAYKDKYLAEANVGYNGSDAFSRAHRYAVFPAGALGWVVSEEGFMKKYLKVIDFFKIRGSYGEVGNDQIAGFSYLYQYEFLPIGSNFNGANAGLSQYIYNLGETATNQPGLKEGPLGNDKVSWEIARKSNLGMDMRLFKNRLNFTADVFVEKRSNILAIRGDLPLYTGLLKSKLPAQNIGRVTNKGYEIELSYNGMIGNLGFRLGGNYTFVHNNVDYIAEAPVKYDYMKITGHPIDQRIGYVWTGKFYDFADLSNPAIPKPVNAVIAGDLIFKDLNGDGMITDDDRTAIGYAELPEKMFGFNLDLNYRNFYLNTFWQGASNTNIMPSGPIRNEFGFNVQQFHKDGRWVYDPSRGLDTRATATYPALQIGGSTLTRLESTFNLLNAEYLRLRAVEFGYNFPEKLTRKLHLNGLRVYLSGSNLLTFDHLGKYNLDPEYSGAANGAYSPQNKFYAFGLNIRF